ncbi:NAD(+)/NADH kinase [Ruminococcaceae bacterium OttesenSCG-928-I18]|nr:NAD(+)/NADH kinase [Ruminococcaceae bacterium OttesenSCG-928-I18]
MKIFLLPNPKKQNALLITEKAATVLVEAGAEVLLESAYRELGLRYVRYLDEESCWEECDVVVTLGGDGSILHAARRAMYKRKPILGVNFGRIGYLTAMEKEELSKLRRLLTGDYTLEERSMLAFEVKGTGIQGHALNDITFFKAAPERIMSVDIYCDDIKVSSFHGDGVVFATPTGSTAYSMSAGGPIVDARMSAIIATQICAHIVKMPPMVFSADRVLHVLSDSAYNDELYLSYDGCRSQKMPVRAEAVIRRSPYTVPLIQYGDANQLEAIDKKLKGR